MFTAYVFSIALSGKSNNVRQVTIPALFIKILTFPTSVLTFFAAAYTFSLFEISTTSE